MKNKEIITVLMTVYNGERFIKEAIKSVLNQTYTNFKFLIIDNASIDNTKIIIRSFKDYRLELVELKINIGQTAALNKGLRMIDTKYVARIDADDLCLPKRIEEQINYLNENLNVDVLGTWAIQINEFDEVIRHIHSPTKGQDLIDYFVVGNPVLHSSVIFNREKIMSVGSYDESLPLTQDADLWLKMISSGAIIKILPLELIKLRKHDDQTTKSHYFQKQKNLEEIKLYKNLIKLNLFNNNIRKRIIVKTKLMNIANLSELYLMSYLIKIVVYLIDFTMEFPENSREKLKGTIKTFGKRLRAIIN